VERAIERLAAEHAPREAAEPSGAVREGSAVRSGGTPDGDSGGRRFWAFHPAPGEDFLDLAAALVNAYAPEHLEIQLADARSFLARVRSSGAVFLERGHPQPLATISPAPTTS